MLTDPDIYYNSPKVSEKYYFEYHPAMVIHFQTHIVIVYDGAFERYYSELGINYISAFLNKNENVWESRCSINQSSSFYLSANYTENKVFSLKKKFVIKQMTKHSSEGSIMSFVSTAQNCRGAHGQTLIHIDTNNGRNCKAELLPGELPEPSDR